ncbi:tartronate semialdehyde reductase [Hydrogenispora ethanolica]|jgi:2-hydroxy-3-oxopropionate reductase|uniref:Tartronate semialdehyde reductase n=1 Tax=Hydrogenispora ethanolica TaxID=1082276 RepID=A0A4V2QCY6_HYDET|nr:2-hydroxy-3-oxopropionate reductase [Hydrogenispora ethanolica]TCL61787.1 tartronate semialdehyde reductase [Hydrogenispora ethanolica]
MQKIGFIGLGIMGKPMAKNLLKAGYRLVVFDMNPEPVRELTQLGAEVAKNAAEVARESEIIITMLPNSPDVKAAVLGQNGILEGAEPGKILIDMSSIAPGASQEIAAKVAEKGVKMLDAPVSGGEPKAIDGTLSIMVGGEEELFNQVKDLLGCMGKSVVWIGPVGSGNVTKLANQIIVALNIIAMSEALVLAQKVGVAPERVYQAIRGGLAGSTVLDAKAPLILKRQFAPGFRIELHLKDLRNAMETGNQFDVPLKFTSLATEVLQALNETGKGRLDHGAIVQYFEKLSGVEVSGC